MKLVLETRHKKMYNFEDILEKSGERYESGFIRAEDLSVSFVIGCSTENIRKDKIIYFVL